jgi:hypothetical protein
VSNVLSFRRPHGSEHAPLSLAPAIVALRGQVSEEIREAIFVLDLSVQQARLTIVRVPDQQARQRLIQQMETIERLIQHARNLSGKL